MRGLAEVQRPQTLADQVAKVLREAIADGTLAQGSPLRQDDLAGRLGFSRMPIRDALRQLEAEGLVQIHPTRGARVARMDAAEITEIYLVRALLECEALRLSVPGLGAERLDAAAAALARGDREPDVRQWGALNRVFHLALYGACGNARLLALIDAQHNAADRYVRILLSNLDYRERSQREHRDLLEASRGGDVEAAVAVLQRHLGDGLETLLAAIARLAAATVTEP